jgi:polyribonucleotide nucleotidyltransferase
MESAIAEPRPEVGKTAPKIVSFEIPIDKIGEVIGPKGKVINAIQAETGADISVDDDGTVGVVAIASTSSEIVDEAERQIKLILNPPTAEVGQTYTGRVVNITKFGAFVNILPGRDGLVHISKLGGNRRIDRVEDEVDLGDEIEVRVDDVDPQGKISLTPTSYEGGGDDGGGDDRPSGRDRGGRGGRDRDRGGRGGRDRDRGGRGGRDRDRDRDRGSSRGDSDADASSSSSSDRVEVSFEDNFEAGLEEDLGDLGPSSGSRRRR